MGRGPAWAVAENMALIKAWLIEANNPIRGTDQSGKEFWGRVLTSWKHLLRNETDAAVKAARDQRGFDALRKQWAKMVAGVMEFSSCIVQARKAKPTGITTHADLVNCAEGLYCGTNVYGRIRGDHADDVATGKKTKRRIKRVTCPWAQYWEVLKDQDRFKSAAAEIAALQKRSAAAHARAAARAAAAAAADGGGVAAEKAAAGGDPAPAAAANAAAAGAAGGQEAPSNADESNDDEGDGPWAGRPMGCKAAKRARAEGIADDRTMGRVASAVEKLGDATTQRTSMMAFSLPFMRETPMGAAFWAHQAKKMLAHEGIKVPSSGQAADASAAADGVGAANKDKVAGAVPAPEKAAHDDISATGHGAADDDVTIVGDTTSSVPPPPPPPTPPPPTPPPAPPATPAPVEQTTGTPPESAAEGTAADSTLTASMAAAASSAPATAASSVAPPAAAAATVAAAADAHVLPARAAAKDVHKQRGRRAQSTKRKQAAAAMDEPLKTTVDLTIPPAAPSAARSSPAAAAAAEAAVVVAPGSAPSAPPSVRRKRRAPPPASGSDDSVSDGGGFDGFDSDLIESFALNCGRSSSESEEE